MWKKAIAGLACGVMLCVSCGVGAGNIAGILLDAGSSGPIAGAQVVASGTAGQGPFFAVTDGAGGYNTGPMPAGDYILRTQTPSHLDETLFVPQVPAAGTVTRNFSLSIGGSIAGHVAGPGGPLAGVEMEIYDTQSGQVAFYLMTDAAGDYATPSKLPTGVFRVRTANYEGLVDEAYPDTPCAGRACPLDSGGAVNVNVGYVTQDVDFYLAQGARLKGAVTRVADGTGVPAPFLQLSDAAGTTQLFFFGDATGAFDTLTGIPPGEWKLLVFPGNGLLGQVYPAMACVNCQIDDGESIVVADANDVVGLDFALQAPATIAGLVTDAQNGGPIEGALVSVLDATTLEVVATATTWTDGSYESGEFVPGDVRLLASAANHFAVSFGNAACVPGCKPEDGVVVAAGEGKTDGVDFGLTPGASIAGTVNGPGGPVPGVTVIVTDANGTATLATTDATGSYATGTALQAGTYRVRTRNAPGLVDEAWPNHLCPGARCDAATGDGVVVTAGQATTGIDFVLVAGTRLAGTVTAAADGAPVQTTLVARHAATQFEFDIQSDPAGGFDTVTGLPGGNWTLVAAGQGALLGEAWQEHPCAPCSHEAGDTIAIAAQPVLDGLDFTLDAGVTVSGAITSAGTGLPLAGATVAFFADATDGSLLRSVTSDAAGTYNSGLLVPGDYRLEISAPGHLGVGVCSGDPCSPAESHWIVADQSVPFNDYALQPASSLTGRVTGPAGHGLAGVQIVLLRLDGTEAGVGATDANGNYQFAPAAGAYALVVHPGGHYLRTAWPGIACGACEAATLPVLTIDGGETLADIDIPVSIGVRFTGTVVADGNGAPLAGVQVRVEPYFDAVASVTALTDADGEWITEALPADDYRIATFNTQGYVDEQFEEVSCPSSCDPDAATPVAGPAGVTVTVDFGLALGGRVSATVREETTGAPLSPFPAVEVHDAFGNLVASGVADGGGHFTSAALPPGTYYLRSRNRSGLIDEWYDEEACTWCAPLGTSPDGSPVSADPVTVAAGQISPEVLIDLEAGPTLSGRVYYLSSGQAPLASAVVEVYDADHRRVTSSSTLPDGTWHTAAALPPGVEYYLVLRGNSVLPDQLFGGAACPAGCDVTAAAPLVVLGVSDVTDLDFPIDDQPVFGDGFEDP